MPSVNNTNPAKDTSVRIFDEFYQFEQIINGNEYDVVNSYLKSVYNDSKAAGDFTVSLFRIAQQSNTPVLTLLDNIKDQDAVRLTNTICYYLNGLQSLSTLYGISSVVLPNSWAARNALP